MTTLNSGDPLLDFKWNEAEVDPLFNRGMLTLIAFNDEDMPFALGTGFVISHVGRNAVCVTAAHVFTEIRRIQSPYQRYASSALPEFLPPPRKIDLSGQKIVAIAMEGDRVDGFIVDAAVIDEARDTAIFTASLQNIDAPEFLSAEFEVEDKIPTVGDLVYVLSYGALSICDFETDGAMKQQFKLARRPVLRVGTVIASYPNGHRLCRGPCIETTVPVYSGMSGGPVFSRGNPGEPMRPFGLVCSDPDPDGPTKQDRSQAGSSIISLLPSQVTMNEQGQRTVKFKLPKAEVAGLFASQGEEAKPK